MSAREIKPALKAARIAIQNKEYDAALHQCEFILKKDDNNYNALVFAGLCYSETKKNNQAKESYKHAIKCQPDQILAYQGFANLYTKHWVRKRTREETMELIEIYKKLLDLMDSKDIKKNVEVTLDLCKTLNEVGHPRQALMLIRDKMPQKDNLDEGMTTALCQVVFESLRVENSDPGFKLEYSKLVTEAFSTLCHTASAGTEAVKIFAEYLSYLRTNLDLFQQNLSLVLDVSVDLHTRWPGEHLPVEVMVQAYVQNYKHTSTEEMHTLIGELEALGGTFARVGLGYLEFQDKKYENALKLLKEGMEHHTAFLPGWVVLCEAMLKLHKYADAEKVSKNALLNYKQLLGGTKDIWMLPITSLENVRFDLTKCFATSLSASLSLKSVETGVATFTKLLHLQPNDADLYIRMAQGLAKLEKFDKASDAINEALNIQADNVDALAWREYINFKGGNTAESITKLENLPPSATSLFLLGKCMWEAGGEHRTVKKNCFTAFVKAAKLDPYMAEIFLLLGHFYTQVQKDNARAKGCYQKAYQLDPASEDAAACLADVYVAEGDTESAIALYESITKEAGPNSCKWAWLRLGLCRLKEKDVNNAIQCFQCALRIDSEDPVCWECLGEGYLQRGSFTAAWKAFGRACDLDPTSVYGLYQMAKVKQVQGMYPDAIREYTDVLKLSPNYVPGLQGLGESELLLARQMMREGRYMTSVEHVEKAMGHLTVACFLRSDLCCLWKLLGDCCIMVHALDDSVVHMKIPVVLLGSKQDDGDKLKLTNVGKSEVLLLSTRFYCRAIGLQSENASLWHDLGMSYVKQATDNMSNQNAELAGKAMNSLKKAITLEPSNHVFWNSLGVVAASKHISDPALAQHCFLTSIKHEQNNVPAWSNLATLYLSHEHIKEAHEAFKVAQSLDPSFVNSWVGQAVIAETVGSSETMDLYRHSTELGIQMQGGAGYSSWVTRIMADRENRQSSLFEDNIRNMNAVSTATTQMSKQCDKDPSCAWSFNVLGFLLEYSGLNQSAEKAYSSSCVSLREAIRLIEDGDGKEELQTKFNKAVSNLARVQCKNGRCIDAVTMYQQISPLSDFYDVCGLALAFHKSGEFVKALEAYKQAGQLTSSETEKAQVMVAMAMTFWKMGKADQAKTLLYKCFQTSKSGLQALCALGILMEDRTLVGAAVGEIMKQKVAKQNQIEKDVTDDCLLVSAAAILCGDAKMAVLEVEKAFHQYPSSWSLRTLLCQLLMSVKEAKGCLSLSAISAQAMTLFKAHCLSNPMDRDSELWKGPKRHEQHVCVSRCNSVSTTAAGDPVARCCLVDDFRLRLREAQIFVHMHPQDPSGWAHLSCAYHAKIVAEWFSGIDTEHTDLVETLVDSSLRLSPEKNSCKIELEKWKEQMISFGQILLEEVTENSDKSHTQKMASKLLNQEQSSPQSLLLQGLALRAQKNQRKSKQLLNRVFNSTDCISDDTRSVAIWYLYRAFHERNDASELEKLVSKVLDLGDKNIAKIMELMPMES